MAAHIEATIKELRKGWIFVSHGASLRQCVLRHALDRHTKQATYISYNDTSTSNSSYPRRERYGVRHWQSELGANL